MTMCRFYLLLFTLLSIPLSALTAQEVAPVLDSPVTDSPVIDSPVGIGTDAKIDVYVIPITDAISKPNLYILRRGLKEAITNKVGMIVLDMDTPGGRVDITIEMMEMLAKFDGITATYVNEDAISAGSFIAAATQEIYFSPQGKMGASAVIQGGGEDVPETARMKIESYLRANIRVMTEDYPYRSDVIRAMLDADFELKIGEETIKPEGELLTLTANEAIREYGDPATTLLGSGIYKSIDDLLDARLGKGNYEIRDFHISYSEGIAKWMNAFAPALMGLGMLLLFLEFKTPGFGIFGILGIVFIAIFFASQSVAGLAGNEPILCFTLGVILILVELFFFPGTMIFALSGFGLMLGSLMWAMIDFWPDEPIRFSTELIAVPFVNLTFGLSIAVFGVMIFGRFFKGTFLGRRMVLADVAGGSSVARREEREASLPAVGASGEAITDLFPSGRIEIDGVRYDARSTLSSIERGTRVTVVKSGDFTLIVKEASE